MSDEDIKRNESAAAMAMRAGQASEATELTEKDLAKVTGGDKATSAPIATEAFNLNFTKIEVKYTQ